MKTLFSIDNGQSWTEVPMIRVQVSDEDETGLQSPHEYLFNFAKDGLTIDRNKFTGNEGEYFPTGTAYIEFADMDT